MGPARNPTYLLTVPVGPLKAGSQVQPQGMLQPGQLITIIGPVGPVELQAREECMVVFAQNNTIIIRMASVFPLFSTIDQINQFIQEDEDQETP